MRILRIDKSISIHFSFLIGEIKKIGYRATSRTAILPTSNTILVLNKGGETQIMAKILVSVADMSIQISAKYIGIGIRIGLSHIDPNFQN